MARTTPSASSVWPSSRNKYRGLASILENRIRNGEFRVGERLPTALELAREFSLSNVTVTRAVQLLSRKGLVSTTARRRGAIVMRRAPRLPLHQTTIACLFRSVMPRNERDNFALDVIEGACAEISRRNYRFIHHNLGEAQYADRVADLIEHGGVCGVLIDQKTPLSIIQRLARYGLPVVLMNRHEDVPNLTCVTPDYDTIGRETVRHFVARGYQRLGFYCQFECELDAVEDQVALWTPVLAARRGFLQEARARGFRDADVTVFPEYGFDGAPLTEPEAFRFPRRKGKTWRSMGIMASSDVMAAEIIQVLGHTDLVVGKDVGVISRLDIEYGHHTPNAPSTYGVDRQEIGARAVQELIARIEDPELQPALVRLPMQFYDRGTA